ALARMVAEELRRAQPERNLEFSAQGELRDEADPRLLQIVLENLLGNAWKFTRQQPHPKVELGKTVVEGESAYFIRDNGVGFDPSFADRLFQPFQRLHTQAEFEGTGVGLATTKRIIERHGGRLWSESTPNQGATFFFTLHPK